MPMTRKQRRYFAPKRSIRHMFNGRRTIHHKKKMTLPIAVIAGIVPGVMRVYQNSPLNGQSISTATAEVTRIYTGYDWRNGQWSIGLMRYGLAPLLAGFGIHKAAQMLGVNRMISQAGIPLLRI